MTLTIPDLAGLRAGGKPALARALTALETDPEAPALIGLLDAAFAAPTGLAVGLTGPPGVGKSTLVGALVAACRARGLRVGVVAVDPSSRRTGGALLGDRTRIPLDPDDPGVFLRSMAARDRLGGLSDITFPAVVLMRGLFDLVLVETVGVGQSEAEIADVADRVVLCVQPGSGDALQYMKAGIAEMPDLVLVTKADMGALADRAAADVAGALSLASGGAAPPVLRVSARAGHGIADAALALSAPLPPARLTERRAEQAGIWMRGRLRAAAGDWGLRLIRPPCRPGEAPFRTCNEGLSSLAQRLCSDRDRTPG